MQHQPRFSLKQVLYIFSGTLFGALVLTIGAIDQRMLILVATEKLMTSAELGLGLVEQTLQ